MTLLEIECRFIMKGWKPGGNGGDEKWKRMERHRKTFHPRSLPVLMSYCMHKSIYELILQVKYGVILIKNIF